MLPAQELPGFGTLLRVLGAVVQGLDLSFNYGSIVPNPKSPPDPGSINPDPGSVCPPPPPPSRHWIKKKHH